MNRISVPTIGGFTSSITDYAVGAVAGLAYNFLGGLIPGGPLVTGAITAGVAGAMLKGAQAQALVTVLGFQAGQSGLGQLGLLGGPQNGNNSNEDDDEI
jgi:hypothetical protein